MDIGGTSVKWAVVDLDRGRLKARRSEVPTPDPAGVAQLGSILIDALAASGVPRSAPVGISFPAPIEDGKALESGNLAAEWKGTDVERALTAAAERPVRVINDGDAAGLAEVRFGAGRGHDGVVVMLTFGTGIGTGLYSGGRLVPNVELATLPVRGEESGLRISNQARKRRKLSWEAWARELQGFIEMVERTVHPDLIIIGGGGSRHAAKFMPLLDVDVRVVTARLRNNAGIVGAALAAASSGDSAAASGSR